MFGTALHQEIGKPEAWWRDRLASPDLGVLVARLDGDPVGMAAWSLPAAANARHRAYVWGVYVRAGLRGHGLGHDLATGTIAAALGVCEAVDLHVLVENTPAIRLYASLGFVVVGTVPRALKHAGVYRDQHLMAFDPPAHSTPGTRHSPVV